MLKSAAARKRLVVLLISAAVGAAMSRSSVLGEFVPFAVIPAAVLPLPYGVAAALGALLPGCFTLSFKIVPLLAALLAALLSRLKKQGDIPRAAISSGAYFLSSALLGAFSGGGFYDFIFSLLISAGLFALCAAFSGIYRAYSSAKSMSPAQLIFFCGAFVCALAPVGEGAVSLGGAAAAWFTLFAALNFGAMPAAAVSAACAVGAGICSPGLFPVYAILCIPALLGGLIRFGGTFKMSALFILILIPSAALFGGRASVGMIADAAAAAILLVLTERPAARLVSESLCDPPPASRFKTELLREALLSASERLRACREKVPCPGGEVMEAICERVCSGGGENSSCRKNGAYLAEMSAGRRETLKQCAGTMSAIAGAITDAERAAIPLRREMGHLSRRLSEGVKKTGARPLGCTVCADGYASVVLPAASRFSEEKIALAGAEILNGGPYAPRRREAGDAVMLEFLPKPRYSAEFGFSQISVGDNPSAVCGDVALGFSCGAWEYFLLSDGMGTGGGARAAAELLGNILKEFILAGFSVETAASLASLEMSAELPEESFATLDLLAVNTRTGAAAVYKAGGCHSFLFSESGQSRLRAGGYPIGILDGCSVKVGRFFVGERADVVMMSDGAAGLSGEAVKKVILGKTEPCPAASAAAICGAVSPKNDDITVAVVKIRKIPR